MSALDHGPLHQVLVAAVPGDPVTEGALATRAALRRRVPSEIFAAHVATPSADGVRPFAESHRHDPTHLDGYTLVHLTSGPERFTAFVLRLVGNLIVADHGVARAQPLEGWDPATARDVALGATLAARIRPRTVATLGPSASICVAERSVGVEPDPQTAHQAGRLVGPVVVAGGPLEPQERPDLIIRALGRLRRHRPAAHLVWVGPTPLDRYSRAVRRLVRSLGLETAVTMTGDITTDARVAWYRRADVVVSAYEGCGLPWSLIEALWLEVPTVARASAAIREAVDDAAVLAPADCGPGLLGQVVDAVLDAPAACSELRARQRERRLLWSEAATTDALLGVLGGLG